MELRGVYIFSWFFVLLNKIVSTPSFETCISLLVMQCTLGEMNQISFKFASKMDTPHYNACIFGSIMACISSNNTWNILDDIRLHFENKRKNTRGRFHHKISKQNIKLIIHPLLSRVLGQYGYQKKRNSSGKSIFWVWCAIFQPKLN